jgi:tetratricopeptide (TPR) repeat protein
MGSKNKKRTGRPTVAGSSGLRQEVERLIAKDHLKDAVKQAKLCFREEATPENHRLLERTYFLRADELRRKAMPTAAREVAQHLLDFGVTDPALVEEAARLFLSLGMSRAAQGLRGRIDSPEVRERFARQEADLAVVHPDRTDGAAVEIREWGQAVRTAIEAIQKGDEVKGLETLRDVSRGSPFADWKLFARGLAASSRGEDGEARANWDRLDPDRAAARIARGLQALARPLAAGASPEGAIAKANVKLNILERQVLGVGVLEPLEQLRALLAQDRWDDAVRQVGSLRQLLAHVDPALSVRLTRIVYSHLIRSATQLDFRDAKSLVKGFTYAAERLPIDPHWNRLWALIWEGPQGEPDQAEHYWRNYLRDLETLPALKPEERVLARALVLKHLGEEHVEEVEAMADSADSPFGPRPSERDLKAERDRAVACFEESLKLAPDHRPTYRALMDAYEDWDRPDDAATVARRLLERFPDDFEAVMFLTNYHFRGQEPDPALEYAKRARALKPLDEHAIANEWAVQVLRARDLAIKGRWDEGRAAFEAAERLRPDESRGLHFRARRAVFELKAGQAERAEALIAEALQALPEATPLWLALLIESIRYELPKPDCERFEARWTTALPKKVRSETAGTLAELMGSFVGGEIDYTGRTGHLKEVLGYLRRTTRIKYEHDDLARACSLLGLLPKEADLFEKLVKRGIKLFPNSPLFLTLSGTLELKKGPFGGGNFRLARDQFEKALERAEASSDPQNVRLVPKIRESLSMLRDLSSSPMGLPFMGTGPDALPGGPGTGGFHDFLGALSGMFGGGPDDDDFDDNFDDEPARLPAPRAKGAARKKAGRKGQKG